jgi:hypothetical protein
MAEWPHPVRADHQPTRYVSEPTGVNLFDRLVALPGFQRID